MIAEFVAALQYKADPKELTEFEKKAKEAAEKSSRAWEKFGTTIRNVGLGALGAAGGLVALVERGAAAGAAIDDVSKRTGESVRDLQRLKFAAEQSGSGLGAVESALKTLDRALIKGAKESGPVVDALRSIGLTTTELIDLPAEAKFSAIAEALAKVENPALQTSAAMALFGGSGAELLPLLQEGASGIKALGDEAEKLGLVMSNEAVAGAAALDDEIGKLKAQAGAITRDLGLALVPALQSVVRNFDSWAVAIAGVGTAYGAAKIAQLPGQLGLAANGMASLALRTAGATTAALALGVALGTALDNALGLSDAIAGVDQQKGGRGAVAIGGMTADEATRLAEAQARLRKAESKGRTFTAFDDLNVAEANAARAEIDKIQNAVRGRQRGVEALTKSRAGVDTFTGRALGEAAIERGLKAGETANELARRQGKKKGGGKRKEFSEDVGAGVFEADELFGDDLRRLAERNGVGEVAVDAALRAAAESLAGGSTQEVAKDAALSALGSRAGKDFGKAKTKDPLLSAIFADENVPDVELSAIARGAEPQVLISNITNTFSFQIAQQIDGTGDPVAVANRTADAIRDFSRGSIEQATKTAKVAFAR